MIDIRAIEKELTALWKEQGEDSEGGGVTRACILNLILFLPLYDSEGSDQSEVNGPDRIEEKEVENILADVTASHPCRALLFKLHRASPETELSARVTSRCTVPDASSKQVCCEQVTIQASEALAEEAASAVVPLLIPDLPVFLWWRSAPDLADATFKYLVENADRVVIDSASFRDPRKDLSLLLTAVSKTSRHAAFSDLNWARLTAWRGLLASFYDITRYRTLLDQSDSLTIEYSPHQRRKGVPIRVLLLAGWLASRLGWKKATQLDSGVDQLSFLSENGQISVHFVKTERQIEPGHLAQVSLGMKGDQSLAFKVRRSSDGARIETSVTFDDTEKAKRILSYDAWSEAALLGRELELEGRDQIYEEALASAVQLAVALNE